MSVMDIFKKPAPAKRFFGDQKEQPFVVPPAHAIPQPKSETPIPQPNKVEEKTQPTASGPNNKVPLPNGAST